LIAFSVLPERTEETAKPSEILRLSFARHLNNTRLRLRIPGCVVKTRGILMNTIIVRVRGKAPKPWRSDKGDFEIIFDGGGGAGLDFV